MWDLSSTNRVDYFIANSHHIANRIKKIYGRESEVIYPPVSIDQFGIGPKESFYVTASRFVPYKRIDLIVESFNTLPDKKLIVIGDGPELSKIKKIARKNVEFLGYLPPEGLKEYLQKARAFIFAAEEDFGILPVEAQASGTPVIAFGKGGCLETVVDGKTGLFFQEQSVESLREAIGRFEEAEHQFEPTQIRAHAEQFSVSRFRTQFKSFVDKKIEERDKGRTFSSNRKALRECCAHQSESLNI